MKASDLILKGYVLTKEICPKCGSPLFRDKYGNLICSKCGYKRLSIKYVIEKKKEELLEILYKEKDVNVIYKILKALKIIKDLENDAVGRNKRRKI